MYDVLPTCRSALMSAAHALENFGSAVLVDNGPPSSSQRTRRDAGIDRATHSAWMVPFANNRGFGEACNAGASAVPRAKLILLVNPDAEVSAATVEKLVSALSLVPTLGIVSAMLVDRVGRKQRVGDAFHRCSGWSLASSLGFDGVVLSTLHHHHSELVAPAWRWSIGFLVPS